MALGALLLACGSPAEEPSESADVDIIPGLSTDLDPDRIAEQQAWVPCGGRIECRTIEVPIDYGAPELESIFLRLTQGGAKS